MTAGQLRERVTIQQAVETPDGGGGSSIDWQDVATVWAEVRPLSGRERLQAQQLESAVNYRIRIRFRSDITAGMRLVWRDQVMNIRAVYNEDQKRAYLTLDCESGVAV